MPTQNGYLEKVIPMFFKKPGFFLEIGCWDGIVISQTEFLEKMGWKGICVDPFPFNFDKRECLLAETAIDGNFTGEKDFVKVTIDRRYGGDVSYLSGFKETISASPENWNLIQEHCDYSIIKVPTISIMEFMEKYNVSTYIDFLSVDTEGAEFSIISNIDFTKYKFGMIIFEHNHNQKNKEMTDKVLIDNGYLPIIETDYDDVFVHKSIWNGTININECNV